MDMRNLIGAFCYYVKAPKMLVFYLKATAYNYPEDYRNSRKMGVAYLTAMDWIFLGDFRNS
jgi:hypothetical protein